MRVLTTFLALALPGLACAGAFTFAEQTDSAPNRDPDNVSHPEGYNIFSGTPSTFNVGVCVVPGSPNASQLEVSIANSVDRFNLMVPVSPSIRFGDLANFGNFDIESVALHELGHCIGLAHPNAASEAPSGSGAQRESTKANRSTNGVLDYDSGTDGLFGSPDDVRGDDDNLHYFDPGTNNPFAVLRAVDSSNFTRLSGSLPGGDNFAANADREVAVLPRYAAADDICSGSVSLSDQCAEAVMQQGSSNAETQRALGPDDVSTLLYARSGLDRVRNTSDDYVPTLVYRGITTTGCDISAAFEPDDGPNNETGFAVCQISASLNSSVSAAGYTAANMFFDLPTAWEFTTVRIPLPGADTATVDQGATTNITDSLLDNDSNQDGSFSDADLRVTNMAFSGPNAGTVSLNANGTWSYTHTDMGAMSDFFVYEVCLNGTSACAHQFVDITINDGEVLFMNGFETP